jgi:hypothetical protein
MPNWCSNHVSIFGDKDQLTALILAAAGDDTDFSISNLFPCPQSLRDAAAGSDEVFYDIVYGDLSKLAGYAWIPDEIKGDRDALLTFVANRQGYHAGKGIGIADLIKYNLETYGAKNWYEWCIKNWGTKWDVEGAGGRNGDDHASYTFDSAWGPPREAFIEISKNFPGLTFDLEYYEPGMCFCGRLEIQNGEMLSDCYDEFHSSSDVEEIIASGVYDFVNGELECYLEMIKEDEEADNG